MIQSGVFFFPKVIAGTQRESFLAHAKTTTYLVMITVREICLKNTLLTLKPNLDEIFQPLVFHITVVSKNQFPIRNRNSCFDKVGALVIYFWLHCQEAYEK